jgi:hypothetical protein
MCFSNLPVEFDEDGDPYLADEADDVTSPGENDRIGAVDDECGCDQNADAAIDAAPEAAYDAILAAMPETARADLTDSGTATTEVDSSADDRHGRDTVEGD